MEKKRRPIRQRFSLIVTISLLASLILSGVIAVTAMFGIRNRSEDALTAVQGERGLSVLKEKSVLADTAFVNYMRITGMIADYIHGIYCHPEMYSPRKVDIPDPANAGIYISQLGSSLELEEFMDVPELKAERELLVNVEDLLYPLITGDDNRIVAIYYGLEDGQIICYDNQSDNKPSEHVPYAFQDTEWYRKCKELKEVCFTDVYTDAFGRGLTITCAAPIYDENNSFAGVVGVDILIKDVYETIVSTDLGTDAYAMLVDSEGNLISPFGDRRSLSDLGVTEEHAGLLLSGGDGMFREDGVYYVYTTVKRVGWTLAAYLPESVVMKPVSDMDRAIVSTMITFVLLIIIVMGIMIVIVNRFTKNLTEPLIALGEDVKCISLGDLDHRATVLNNDEIGDLAISFNEMTASLKQHMKALTKVTSERERLGAELDVATNIQADMLPGTFPAFPERREFDIFASMTPAREIGGDFYDFFLIDKYHLAMVMADVSGKGIPAALFMAISKTVIQSRAMAGGEPAEILSDVNKWLCANNKESLFVTVWLGILDIGSGEVKYASAGHEYPMIISNKGVKLVKREAGANDPPLSLSETVSFSTMSLHLNRGDFLLLYTDGIPEAKNRDGARYGMDRLKRISGIGGSVKTVVETIDSDVASFTRGMDPFDDMTLLCLEYKGGAI